MAQKKEQDLSTLTDGTLVGYFLQTNDKKVLSVLYQRHAAWIYHKCLALVKSTESAEDLTHDIFLRAFLKLSTLKDPERLGGWLSTIAYNMSINFLNLRRDFQSEAIETHHQLSSTDEESREEASLREITLAELERLLHHLPDSDRVILLMRFQDEMSIKEIQDTLKIGESAVKMRLKRAKEKLARLFEESKTEIRYE
ncbi:MAG: RNA polymerase sigma factor [Microscillaceae bacterium]